MMRLMSKTHTLSIDQLNALRAFADANGRTLKSKLNEVWSTGRYGTYQGTTDEGCLQQVRNTFGPSWLVKFKLGNSATHSVKI